jgi:hypothetical protein
MNLGKVSVTCLLVWFANTNVPAYNSDLPIYSYHTPIEYGTKLA